MLNVSSLSKSFPGVRALSDVSIEFEPGKAHALVGENGAGKSTLLKILSGVYHSDSGEIILDGVPQRFATPYSAIQAGIAIIYQELHLAPELTVAENICLGHLPNRLGLVNKPELIARARQLLQEVGIEVDPEEKVGKLPLAQRQMVEIAKALSRDAKVIAFDEPTSSLSARETERLFKIIHELKAQGRTVLYVTHRMEEIFRVCDQASVLRDGCLIETFKSLEGVTAQTLVSRMVGRAIEDVFGYTPRPVGGELLQVQDLLAPGLSEPISLQVKAGEVVGLFGLVGAGRTELLKAICGANRPTQGQVFLEGKPATANSPAGAIAQGICLCPEDRKKEGIVPVRSVKENVNLSARRLHAHLGLVINEPWERQNSQSQVDRLKVKTPSLQQPINLLSGGNQQKVILGRWLSEDVKLLLLDEPTRGIDVGAKREIYDIIFGLAKQGVGILLVSSDLPEVLGVSDRILVMREGTLSGEVLRGDATEERVLSLALPTTSEGAA